MSNTVKETIIEKAIEKGLDCIFGVSTSEFKNYMDRNKKQKILLNCINRFSQSDLFKNEFRNVFYFEKNNTIMSIDDAEIDVSLQLSDISQSITPFIKQMFVSDDTISSKRIADIITTQYIQQATATMQLYDLLCRQRESFESLDSSLFDIRNTIITAFEQERVYEIEKQKLAQVELFNETEHILLDFVNKYLYFMCKKSPSFTGVDPNNKDSLKIAQLTKAEEVVKNINDYITTDFCRSPISCTIVNGLQNQDMVIEYFKFTELVFKKTILDGTFKLLQYKEYMDTETIVHIFRLRNLLQSNMFPNLYEMGQTNVINSKNITIDIVYFADILSQIGNEILCLCNKFVRR